MSSSTKLQCTHEPCTMSKLEQVSSELWSLMDVHSCSSVIIHIVHAFGYKIWDQDLEFCVAE